MKDLINLFAVTILLCCALSVFVGMTTLGGLIFYDTTVIQYFTLFAGAICSFCTINYSLKALKK